MSDDKSITDTYEIELVRNEELGIITVGIKHKNREFAYMDDSLTHDLSDPYFILGWIGAKMYLFEDD